MRARALPCLVALLLLIGTTGSARAEVEEDLNAPSEDAAVANESPFPSAIDSAVAEVAAADADPGPRLPNGEPAPPPDLVSDAGGCSCRAAASTGSATLLPLALAIVAALLRRR